MSYGFRVFTDKTAAREHTQCAHRTTRSGTQQEWDPTAFGGTGGLVDVVVEQCTDTCRERLL